MKASAEGLKNRTFFALNCMMSIPKMTKAVKLFRS